MQKFGQWVSVNDELPKTGKKVIATFANSYGKRRTICAHYIHRFECEAESECETFEWGDDEETAYVLEGWYENIENWGDFSSVVVCEGEITHWMPLPEGPVDA